MENEESDNATIDSEQLTYSSSNSSETQCSDDESDSGSEQEVPEYVLLSNCFAITTLIIS